MNPTAANVVVSLPSRDRTEDLASENKRLRAELELAKENYLIAKTRIKELLDERIDDAKRLDWLSCVDWPTNLADLARRFGIIVDLREAVDVAMQKRER